MNNQNEEIHRIKDAHSDYLIENLKFKILNSRNITDEIIINKFLQNERFQNFELHKLEDNIQSLYSDYIKNITFKPSLMYINVLGDFNKENNLILESNFSFNKFYLTPINYYYLLKPNSLMFKGNYMSYLNRDDDKSKIKENEISSGFIYENKHYKKSFFFSDTLFVKDKNEIQTLIKYSNSDRDTKRKQINSLFRIIFSHNFHIRPFIFRERVTYDNINQAGIQYTHKIIKNYLDQYNCSSELVAQTPQEDSHHQLKLFYHRNIVNENNILSMKISTSLTKSVNSLFLKNKIFIRKIFFYERFKHQLNFELGNIISKSGLKIHENMLISNFTGIRNPGRKFHVDEGKIGDAIGHTNYFMVKNKIIFDDIPIFNNFNILKHGFQISPYFHCNALYTPKDVIEESDSNFYYSAGFGINIITEAVSLELNYTPFVKKNKQDNWLEFSINIGID